MTEELNRAMMFAELAHRGHFRRDGKPYFTHLEAVANGVSSDEAKTVAYLHDCVEDGKATLEDLLLSGFSLDVVEAVDDLTKREGDTYECYIKWISENPLAREVKIADLLHNLEGNTNAGQVERYKKALAFLRS